MMNPKQLKLLDFVIQQHGSQKRKYNNEPYWFHLYRVAEMAEYYEVPFGFEIGLCHDLIEDTGLKLPDLTAALQSFGYHRTQINPIVSAVNDLTDVYTSEAHPTLNRKERKRLEAERLWLIPNHVQTIKYCDLYDNTSTIVPYDPKFAELYLTEKRYILSGMNKGNRELYDIVNKIAHEKHSEITN